MQESILLCFDIVIVRNFTFIPKSSARIIKIEKVKIVTTVMHHNQYYT
jgi:hypothetical protein